MISRYSKIRFILSFGITISTCMLWVVAGTLVMPHNAHAVTCGTYAHGVCNGASNQYAGGFNPKTGFGGFGGGTCTATKTPVIFIHGNGDNATSWDAPPGKVTGFTAAPRSVYAEMKAHGYNDCELFGITYLSDDERKTKNVGKNYHKPAKYLIIRDFINAVKAYTGKSQVDIVAHSLGVTQTLATIHTYNLDDSVRRFVNIGGALRGLYSCYQTGFNNPITTTCNSQNLVDDNVFGFFPEGFVGLLWVPNNWTGTGTSKSLRQAPKYHGKTSFYTISASSKDELICSSTASLSDCDRISKFDAAKNVKAQINVGAGKDAAHIDPDWSDDSPFNLMGGDSSNGVGHFRSKDNAGSIIQRMLLTDCSGLDCAADYTYGPKALY
ncbi:MAG: extracellular native short-chain-length polyhydroxyalkanoate depolymerase PhaZ7 [Burkholderiaceae bacterium]